MPLKITKLLILLLIPLSISGMMPERPVTAFKPQLPDSLNGVQIGFEVKEIKIKRDGEALNLYCLSANILNRNSFPVEFLISYTFLYEETTRQIRIGPHQQMVLLLDKQVLKRMSRSDAKSLYSRVRLATPDNSDNSYSVLSSVESPLGR